MSQTDTTNITLIVEDDRAIAEMLRGILEEEGHIVLVAYSIAQAKLIAGNEQVILVVLDVTLPDGNGLEFCPILKEMTGAPIILLSAMTTSGIVEQAAEKGASGYIQKPFDLDELLLLVRSVLGSECEAKPIAV